MEARRRYSSSTALEESTSTELHFVYVSDDDEKTAQRRPNDIDDDGDEEEAAPAVRRSASPPTVVATSPVGRSGSSGGSSSARAVMSKEDKERHIEDTLVQWGAPKRELRRSSSLESSAERIKNAVEDWAGSPTRVRVAGRESPVSRETRQQEKEAARRRQERVRIAVDSWAEGPPCLHAVRRSEERRQNNNNNSNNNGRESQQRVVVNSGGNSVLLVVEAESEATRAARRGVALAQVLAAVRAMPSPRAEDVSRMASNASVKGGGPGGSLGVLHFLAESLQDPSSASLLTAAPGGNLAAALRLLPPECPTMRVARLFARSTVAPLDLAMKDACPFVFNSLRRSWSVRVEIFSSLVVVAHTRTESSAPGHDERFEFSWTATFLMRGGPAWEIEELFLELTHVEAEDQKVAEKLQAMFLD